MSYTIKFFANPNADPDFDLDLGGSGLGFYGPNFSDSVPVGSYEDTVYITDSNGVVEGALGISCKYLSINSGIINNTGSGLNLLEIPNWQSTLNIRFTNDVACQVNNVKLYIYDRTSIVNRASGVTCWAAEVIHPSIIQDLTGSGDTSWVAMSGSASYLNLSESPGSSGFFAGSGQGSTHSDTTHDFYVLLSASPDTIGEKKLFGLYLTGEYQ